MTTISVKEIKLPKDHMLMPEIDFGEDFEALEPLKKVIYLKKLSSSLNHAADLIQKERNKLSEECIVLAAVAQNAENSANIQKGIVLKSITERNLEKQDFIKKMQELEQELRVYKQELRVYKESN